MGSNQPVSDSSDDTVVVAPTSTLQLPLVRKNVLQQQ